MSMQMHLTGRDMTPSTSPSEVVVTAWARLVRVERGLVAAVEADLSTAGQPPLCWYDVLLELDRAPRGQLSPGEIETHTLFAQYNTSRLIDRLEKEGLVRRVPYPGDRRRQLVEITEEGRALRSRMWPVYAAAIERHVGAQLTEDEAGRLASLLGKLIQRRWTE